MQFHTHSLRLSEFHTISFRFTESRSNMLRSIQPHSNPVRFIQSCSRFSLISTDSFRFIQICSDWLRQALTDKSWREKGNANTLTAKREKGRREDPHIHPWFDMNNTARTHARTGRNDLPVGVLCPCRLASPQPPISILQDPEMSWRGWRGGHQMTTQTKRSCP